jgi:hypothetical protein
VTSAGVYQDNESLYREVYEGTDSAYDIDSIEKIYVCGAGAAWIRGLADYQGADFLLDKYQMNKCVNESLAFCPEVRREVAQAVAGFDLAAVQAALKKARQQATTEAEEERTSRCRKYLVGNWDGIYSWKTEGCIGCSAEGHATCCLHVLAAVPWPGVRLEQIRWPSSGP